MTDLLAGFRAAYPDFDLHVHMHCEDCNVKGLNGDLRYFGGDDAAVAEGLPWVDYVARPGARPGSPGSHGSWCEACYGRLTRKLEDAADLSSVPRTVFRVVPITSGKPVDPSQVVRRQPQPDTISCGDGSKDGHLGQRLGWHEGPPSGFALGRSRQQC